MQTFSYSRLGPDCQVNAKSCGFLVLSVSKAASKCPQHLTLTEDLWPAEWLDLAGQRCQRDCCKHQFASLKRRDVDIIYLLGVGWHVTPSKKG
jgi:hypothetical protein